MGKFGEIKSSLTISTIDGGFPPPASVLNAIGHYEMPPKAAASVDQLAEQALADFRTSLARGL
jgi:hypothetical protein